MNMVKIRILGKGFNTTHFGFLSAEKEVEVSELFAAYCVDSMKSARYVDEPPKTKTLPTTPKPTVAKK